MQSSKKIKRGQMEPPISSDITNALGYTPEDLANKVNILDHDGTAELFPTVDTINNALKVITRAVTTSGLLDPSDTFKAIKFDDFTLRFEPIESGIFHSDFFVPTKGISQIIRSFPQTDYPLSALLGTLAEGESKILFVGIDLDGNVITDIFPYDNNPSVIGLCNIYIKKTGGVVSFLDVDHNVFNNVELAGYSQLTKDNAGYTADVGIEGNTDKSMELLGGSIVGMGINWKTPSNPINATSVNVRQIVAQPTLSFAFILPNSHLNPYPVEVTQLQTTEYWNGSTLTTVTGNNKATNQALLMGLDGKFIVLVGQTEYGSLDDAVRNALSATFTNPYTDDFYIEIGIISTIKAADNFTQLTDYRFTPTGRVNGGGGSSIPYVPEDVENKQDSLAVDGTGTKYPTVDAINAQGFVHLAGTETITGLKTFSSNTAFQGSIGIGTIPPISVYKLEILGNNAIGSNVGVLSTSQTPTTGINVGFFSNVLNSTGNNVVHLMTGNNALPTGGWGIYQSDGNKDYFSGNVLIGTTTDNSNFRLQVVGNDALINSVRVGRGTGSIASNTAVGATALNANTTGNSNVAVGNFALNSNTTGNRLVGIGYGSLFLNSTGSNNTGIGANVLNNNQTTSNNTAVGDNSLINLTTGGTNTAIGSEAGRFWGGSTSSLLSATQSVFVGTQSRALSDGNTNEIVIGYNTIGNGTNTVTLGNNSITNTYLKGNVRGTTFIKAGGTAIQPLMADGNTNYSIQNNLLVDGTGFKIPTIDGVNDEFDYVQSTGVLSGGVLSINADPTKFDLSAGIGYIVNSTNLANVTRTRVAWNAFTAQTVTNLGTQLVTYISIDSSGNIFQQATFPTVAERRQRMIIGRLNHATLTAISFTDTFPDMLQGPMSQYFDLTNAMGPFNIAGNLISANGANLSINKSAGSSFNASFNYAVNNQSPNNIDNPGLTLISFRHQNQNSTDSSNVTVIDPTSYDVANVTTTVPNPVATATAMRVYMFPSNQIRVQRGQATYANLAAAISGYKNEVYIENPSNTGVAIWVATIVVQKNCTSLQDAATARIIIEPKFGGSSGAAGVTTANLQSAYNNSVNPEIITNLLLGAFTVQRGSSLDTDLIIEGRNGAGATTSGIDGNGVITGASFIVNTGTMRLKGYTVGTLPAGVVGDTAYVTDASAPAFNTTVTGGGAITIKVFYNGTNWVT